MENQICIFCRIVKKETPSKLVYEDKDHIAFLDINPYTKGHTLIIPKKHYETFLDLPAHENKELFALAQKLGKTLKNALKPQLVFLSVFGDLVAHAHVHVIPYYGEFPFKNSTKDTTSLDEVLREIKEYKEGLADSRTR